MNVLSKMQMNLVPMNDSDESGQYLEQATAAVKATLNDIFVNIQSRLDPKNLDTNFSLGLSSSLSDTKNCQDRACIITTC